MAAGVDIVNDAVEGDQIRTGGGSIGTTPGALAGAFGAKLKSGVRIKAHRTNSGTIDVRVNSAVGFQLSGGDEVPVPTTDMLNSIVIVGSAASQAYSWIAY